MDKEKGRQNINAGGSFLREKLSGFSVIS